MSSTGSDRPVLRLGTRGSALALAQTESVRAALGAAHPDLARDGAVEIVRIKTSGDKIQDRTLAEIGGKGLFTKEIEEALIDGRIDAAVHSLKDLPTWLPEGLALASILPRADPRDALISRAGDSIAALPEGATVGTASLRRAAQVRLLRPDLEVVPLRGNVETRLRKLDAGQVAATFLAVAGLERLGRSAAMTAPLSPEEMLPAVAQGAIGLEVRAGDRRVLDRLDALDDPPSALRVAAERACLEVLDGSCRTPIAALAELEDEGTRLRLRALVCRPDGGAVYRDERSGPAADAVALGKAAGQALRAAAGEAFFAALADEI